MEEVWYLLLCPPHTQRARRRTAQILKIGSLSPSACSGMVMVTKRYYSHTVLEVFEIKEPTSSNVWLPPQMALYLPFYEFHRGSILGSGKKKCQGKYGPDWSNFKNHKYSLLDICLLFYGIYVCFFFLFFSFILHVFSPLKATLSLHETCVCAILISLSETTGNTNHQTPLDYKECIVDCMNAYLHFGDTV